MYRLSWCNKFITWFVNKKAMEKENSLAIILFINFCSFLGLLMHLVVECKYIMILWAQHQMKAGKSLSVFLFIFFFYRYYRRYSDYRCNAGCSTCILCLTALLLLDFTWFTTLCTLHRAKFASILIFFE